jgi:hypothetical protein
MVKLRSEVHAFCPTCDRWQGIHIVPLRRVGQDDNRVPLHVRCGWCGGMCVIQLRRRERANDPHRQAARRARNA